MGQPRSRWASSAGNKRKSREEKRAELAFMYGASEHKVATQTPLTATALTADTCCAIGVHSQWCGCLS